METRVAVPLRAGGKKMRKRKELDALGRRGRRAHSGGGVSSQDGLLSDSTDEAEGEEWRGKARRADPRPGWARRRSCLGVLRACTLVLVFACVVATTTVMWLFIDVREQATFLRNQLDQVVAGSQGVPEALQKCHSLSKQLQQNQTALFIKLNMLTAQLNNFTSQVTIISNSLAKVEQRLKTSPELIKVPHDLEALTTNIATLGSQMQDVEATVAQLKEANAKAAEAARALQTNLTQLREEVGNVHVGVAASVAPSADADVQAVTTTVNSLRANLTLINDTLSKKIQWAADDQTNQYKQIVSLQERNENVSTRVTSLQNECSARNAQVTTLASSVDTLTTQVKKQEEHWSQVTTRVGELSQVCARVENNYTQLSRELSSVRAALNNSSTRSESASTSPSVPSSTVPSEGLKES